MSAYSYRLPRRYRYRARRKGGKITREQAAVLAVVLIAAGAGTKAATVTAHHAASPATVAASRTAAASEAIAYARRQLGRPYVWGGCGPAGCPAYGGAPSDGFDCSGLAMMAYASAGITIRRTSQDQWATERHIPASQVQPGDLVFFAGSDGTMSSPGHVGIVIGGGKMIQALGTGYPVMVSTYHRPDLVGFTDPASLAVVTAAIRTAIPGGAGDTPSSWAAALLTAGGWPRTSCNLAAVTVWERGEGGGFGNQAANDPLNLNPPAGTTWPGKAVVGAWAFPDAATGLRYTVATLNNGYYGGILAALRAGNSAQAVCDAIVASPWAASRYGGTLTATC